MVNSIRAAVPSALAVIGLLAATLFVPAATLAQTSSESENETVKKSSGSNTAAPDDRRFLQIFTYDAAVVENFWIEGKLRASKGYDGAFGQSDFDSLRLGPVFAWSPIDRLEVGARIDYLDRDIPGGGSNSGLSDTNIYAKWQFFHNPVQFAAGMEISLPTGKEDDGLGTGEFDIALFGSVRKNLEQAYITGYFGIRNSQDSTLFNSPVPLEGDTSIFLGGGVMFPINQVFSLSGELRVETERYKQADSFIDLTVGAFWYTTKKTTLRGGLSLGLEDAAPDYELTVGFAWHF
jgi:hypothetical protein